MEKKHHTTKQSKANFITEKDKKRERDSIDPDCHENSQKELQHLAESREMWQKKKKIDQKLMAGKALKIRQEKSNQNIKISVIVDKQALRVNKILSEDSFEITETKKKYHVLLQIDVNIHFTDFILRHMILHNIPLNLFETNSTKELSKRPEGSLTGKGFFGEASVSIAHAGTWTS